MARALALALAALNLDSLSSVLLCASMPVSSSSLRTRSSRSVVHSKDRGRSASSHCPVWSWAARARAVEKMRDWRIRGKANQC